MQREQETLLGRGAGAESRRVWGPRRTAPAVHSLGVCSEGVSLWAVSGQ